MPSYTGSNRPFGKGRVKTMFGKKFTRVAAAVLLTAAMGSVGFVQQVFAKEYDRVVVLSDVHYVSKDRDKAARAQKITMKQNAVKDINGWNDVDLCVFTGDITELAASKEEYRLAHQLTDKVTHPKIFLAGNHEVVYSEVPAVKGKLQPANPVERIEHIQRYVENYGPLYQAKDLGSYLLLTLSPRCGGRPYPDHETVRRGTVEGPAHVAPGGAEGQPQPADHHFLPYAAAGHHRPVGPGKQRPQLHLSGR